MLALNHLAILSSAIAAIMLGYVWFDLAFGKSLAKLEGRDCAAKPDPKVMMKSVAIGFLSAWVSSYAFAMLVELIRERGGSLGQAIMWVWAGFYLPVQLQRMAWELKDSKIATIFLAFDAIWLTGAGLLLWNWR